MVPLWHQEGGKGPAFGWGLRFVDIRRKQAVSVDALCGRRVIFRKREHFLVTDLLKLCSFSVLLHVLCFCPWNIFVVVRCVGKDHEKSWHRYIHQNT